MGISKTECKLLFYSKTLGVSFANSLTLGRQQLYLSKSDIHAIADKYQNAETGIEKVEFKDEFCEPLFEMLGAKKTESMDFSPYQKATLIHDLNFPVPAELHNRYDCLFDGGTLEHVFNFPVAIKNCMSMIKPGGHFISFAPANNQTGHGFYQFSPELFFRIFSGDNGFALKKLFVTVMYDSDAICYEVTDPAIAKSRIIIQNNLPLGLMVIAEKKYEREIFLVIPQQSDYTATWNIYNSLNKTEEQKSDKSWRNYFRKLLPKRIKIILRNLYNLYSREKVTMDGLGEVNPSHFKRVDI